MTNTPTPLDPIAQLVAKYQSNGHQTTALSSQPAPQPQKKKGWLGFTEKTLWDWLNLLGVLLIPIVIAAGSIWFSAQQNATSLQLGDKQRQSDQAIALDQQRAATLKTYMDDMTGLLLHEGLRESKANASVRVIARAKTLVALTQLNGERKGTLIRFLYEAQLIGYRSDGENIGSIISLEAADLKGADLHGANLYVADLSYAHLEGADLHRANLVMTNLRDAHLEGTDLLQADLKGANLVSANVSHAHLRRADLEVADLSYANLEGANLKEADLRYATLIAAEVTPQQLAGAYLLEYVQLPDGSRYPSSSYPIPNHQEPTF